jgi:hypothetical protein
MIFSCDTIIKEVPRKKAKNVSIKLTATVKNDMAKV